MSFFTMSRSVIGVLGVQFLLVSCGVSSSSNHPVLKGENIASDSNLLAIDFDKPLSFEDFMKILQTETVDRAILPPIQKNQVDKSVADLIEVAFDKSMKARNGDTVYYMFGNLETAYVNQEYRQAVATINSLRAAGWKVTIDGVVSKREAQTYFNNSDMRAFFWSSHGGQGRGGKNYVTSKESATTYDTFFASEFPKRNESQVSMGILCSCYSGGMLNDVSAKLKMPSGSLYGSNATITVSECARAAGPDFVTYFNRHVN